MNTHRPRLFPIVLIIALTLLACDRRRGASMKADSSALASESKVDPETARGTALARVPGGKIEQEELEHEGGKLVYSFDIRTAGKPGIEEVQVNAVDGFVVSVKHEDAAAEAAEAKRDSTKAR